MSIDNENLNITLFCLDYAKDSANLSVTKEQIAEAKGWLLAMVTEYHKLLAKQMANDLIKLGD